MLPKLSVSRQNSAQNRQGSGSNDIFSEESSPFAPKTLSVAKSGNFTPISQIAADHAHEFNDHLSALMPVIPPRQFDSLPVIATTVVDDKPEWFVVLSPREVHGVVGPKSVSDMKKMYKYGEITDATLIWREGNPIWERLTHVNEVRFRLLQQPIVPAKSVITTANTISLSENMSSFQKFWSQPISRYCSVCGNVAVGHTQGVGEQAPSFSTFTPHGSTSVASELIPGFVWIGNAASAKQNPINELAITLAINCTPNLKGALAKPPFFRSRTAALEEKPTEAVPDAKKLEEILFMFGAAFDYIENERLSPERQIKSDWPKKEYRGPTDKFGRPLQKDTSGEYPTNRPPFDSKFPPSRVLLWSRLGFDRACVIGAAYIVRLWGLSVEKALDIVEVCRPGVKISRSYLYALKEWGKMYTLGTMYCEDCLIVAKGEEDSGKEAVLHGGEVTSLLARIQSSTIPTLKNESFADPAIFLPLVYDCAEGVAGLPDLVLPAPSVALIHDLSLFGARLGDEGVCFLLTALSECSLLQGLRVIDLGNNEITDAGVDHLVHTIAPVTTATGASKGIDYLDLCTLVLRQNRIESTGARHIGYLLKHIFSLTSLDVSNNDLGDVGVASIIETLGTPAFYSDEPDHHMDSASFNNSLTDLNVANTGMGKVATDALVFIFRSNETLSSLNIDWNPDIPKTAIKSLSSSLRLNNTIMERISYSDCVQTIKSFGYMMKILEGHTPLRFLNFARSHLSGAHLAAAAKFIPHSKYLVHIDLSGNDIGELGAQHLAAALKSSTPRQLLIFSASQSTMSSVIELGSPAKMALESASLVSEEDQAVPQTVDHSHHQALCAPIKHLDISACNIPPEGCKAIIRALACHSTVRYVDMSDNDFGPDIEDISDSLAYCRMRDLRLSRCKLQTKGARIVLDVLNRTDPGMLGSYLASVSLSGNDVSDSIMPALDQFLQHNMLIQSIDLGFNVITNERLESLREATSLPSSAPVAKQILPLHVNMIGNPCDPYVLETPGLSRSKQTLRFGIRKEQYNTRNADGSVRIPFDNITFGARDQYKQRIELFQQYAMETPQVGINNIN